MIQTQELPEELKKEEYLMNCSIHEEDCFTNIFVKHDSFTVGDLYKALKKFKLMSYIYTNNKDEREIINGPLSFVVGDVRVVVFKER